jgi:hypothetical protein
MSLEAPRYYQTAILRFRLHLLETLVTTAQQGVLAILDLLEFIDFYQETLFNQGQFGHRNLAINSVITLRNSIVDAINSINRE